MKFLIETIRRQIPAASRNSETGETVPGATILETKILGLRIYALRATSFVREYRLLSIPIKRYRLKGWEIVPL